MSGKYKEDITKGNSVIDPRNYKGDSMIQAWIDRRKIATLMLWLEEGGYEIRFMSDILRLAIDELVEAIKGQKGSTIVEFTSDATALLARFKTNLNPNKRGIKNLHHNLLLDERRKDRFKPDDVNTKPMISDKIEKARKLAEEGARVYQELVDKGSVDQEAIKNAINNHQEENFTVAMTDYEDGKIKVDQISTHQYLKSESGLNNLINQKRPCEIEEPFHSSHHPEIKEAVYKELSSRSITESIVDVDRNQLLAKLADDKLKDMP